MSRLLSSVVVSSDSLLDADSDSDSDSAAAGGADSVAGVADSAEEFLLITVATLPFSNSIFTLLSTLTETLCFFTLVTSP